MWSDYVAMDTKQLYLSWSKVEFIDSHGCEPDVNKSAWMTEKNGPFSDIWFFNFISNSLLRAVAFKGNLSY